MVDRELAAMRDDVYWQPESGSSDATGTFEMTERSAQRATLNEASAVEHEVSGRRGWTDRCPERGMYGLDDGAEPFD